MGDKLQQSTALSRNVAGRQNRHYFPKGIKIHGRGREENSLMMKATRLRKIALRKKLRRKREMESSVRPIKCDVCKKLLPNPIGRLFIEDRLEHGRLNPVCRSCLDARYSIADDSGGPLKSDEVIVLFKDKVGVKYQKKPRMLSPESDIGEEKHLAFESDVIASQVPEDHNSVAQITLETREKSFDGVHRGCLKCRYCDSVFVASLAISHAASHCANDSFPCCFCCNEFNNDISLEKHLEDVHISLSPDDSISFERSGQIFSEDQNAGSNATYHTQPEQDETKSEHAYAEEGTDNVKHMELTESDMQCFKGEPVYFENYKDFTAMVEIDGKALTPEEEVVMNELLSQYDITDIDPDIFKVLKANILGTIRASAMLEVKNEPDSGDYNDVFECTDCLRQFDSYDLVCDHKCAEFDARLRRPVKRKRGRPRKNCNLVQVFKREIGSDEEVHDSDQDPEWKLDDQDVNDVDEDTDYVIDKNSSKYVKAELPEYAPRSVPSECEHCGMQFRSKIRLQFHLKYHRPPYSEADELIYDCTFCPELRFDTETMLFDHINFQHKATKLLICPIKSCQRTFNKNSRAYYQKHMRNHSGVRNFPCKDCDKKFLDRQTLVEHSVIHMKVKPYQCHICFRYMTRRSRLRNHLKNHDSELVTNAVYACRLCQMGFKDVYNAEEHASICRGCITDADVIRELQEEAESCGFVEVTGEEFDKRKHSKPYRVSRHTEMFDKALKMFSELSPETQDTLKVSIVRKALKCEYCETVYLTFKSLRRHWTLHDGVKLPFQCNICQASYPTYARVTSHKTTHGYYRRSSTDIRLEESRFVESMEMQELTLPEQRNPDLRVGTKGYFPVIKHFLCNECDKTQLHWTYLQIHKRVHHSKNSNSKCKICGELFPNSWTVAYHRRKVHNIMPKRRIDSSKQESFRYNCKDCGKITYSKSAMHYHRRTAHALHSCAKCLMKFGTRVGLEAHLINKHKNEDSATAKGGHKCTMCSNCYMYSAGLYTHMKRVHEKSLNHKCSICKQSYFSRYELDSHVRSHTDERPFKCVYCGKGFRNTSLRNSHEKIHLDIRPYQCDKCESAFRRSSALKNHLLLHTGVKKFVCTICHRRFWNHSALKFHTKKRHSSEPTKDFLLLKVPGYKLSEDDIVEQLRLFNIPRSKILNITEFNFKKGTELPKSLDLSEVPDFEAMAIAFKDNGEPTLISEKGKMIANVLKKPIAPVVTRPNYELNGISMSKNAIGHLDASASETVLVPITQELIVDGQKITKEIVVMDGGRQSKNRQANKMPVYTYNESHQLLESNTLNISHEDNLVVMADGKVIVQGEIYQLESTEGEPLNLENAVIRLDEHGQLVIEESARSGQAEVGEDTLNAKSMPDLL